MQPMVRSAPRLLLDSIASSSAPRPLRISSRPLTRAPACLRCRTRQQVRRYADDSKPATTPNPSKPPQDSPLQPMEDVLPEELPSAEEGRRSAVTKRFSHIMDHLQGNIFIASQRINDLTGYSGIEALKSRISALESRVQASQEGVRSARNAYKTTVADRAATQREVTTLLARKDSWTPIDLERFTSLYRMDHSNEQAVQEAATKLADMEREAEHAASKLSSSILSRYHEEQIWSDKIRRMSTWGTWGLMGVNILLFFVFQFGFEPWRRARLVHGFEEKVREALEKEKLFQSARHDYTEDTIPVEGILAAGVQELELGTESSKQKSDPVVDAVVTSIRQDIGQEEVDQTQINWQEETASMHAGDIHVPGLLPQLRKPETWTPAFKDLFSQRIITLRKQDVTVIALEGAATGAALVTIIATLIFRHS